MRDNLKKLQKEWYAKLEETGFNDIEYFEEKHDRLEPKMHLLKSNLPTPNIIEIKPDMKLNTGTDKETFYILARRFTFTHKWENADQKRMWELYAEGYCPNSIKDIMKLSQSRRTISRRINELTKVMLNSKFTTDEEHWSVKT